MSGQVKEQRKKKVYAARRFAKGAMSCPSCRHKFEGAVEVCPQCGFCGHVAVKKFPFPAPALEGVMDSGGVLAKRQKEGVERVLVRLRRKMPQVRFFLCLVPLPREMDLREFGFWLFNAGKLSEGDEAKNFGVLFLVDTQSKRLSVTVGYGVEPMVTDSQWTEVCQKNREFFFRERFQEGLEGFLAESTEILVRRGEALAEKERKAKKGGKG